MDAGWTRPAGGVGMRSMRERAAEIGGDVTLSPGRERGTILSARLPGRPLDARRGSDMTEPSEDEGETGAKPIRC